MSEGEGIILGMLLIVPYCIGWWIAMGRIERGDYDR